jgi:hypothetical protein
VVPITEQERARAEESRIEPSGSSPDAQSRSFGAPDKAPARTVSPAVAPKAPVLAAQPVKTASSSAPKKRALETLEQTLEILAARESWTDTDTLSETGVRHLKVDFQKRLKQGR